MEKHIGENDFEQVTVVCNNCGNEMKFFSTDEEGDMFFLQYLCEKCDKVVWVLDNKKRYLKDIGRFLLQNGMKRNRMLISKIVCFNK